MNRIDDLKNYFASLEEVKRLHELEPYIKNNKEINEKFDLLIDKQKQIVNAKEFNQIKQLKIYEEEYKKIKEELIALPFVEEYIELVELINNNGENEVNRSIVDSEIKQVVNNRVSYNFIDNTLKADEAKEDDVDNSLVFEDEE